MARKRTSDKLNILVLQKSIADLRSAAKRDFDAETILSVDQHLATYHELARRCYEHVDSDLIRLIQPSTDYNKKANGTGQRIGLTKLQELETNAALLESLLKTGPQRLAPHDLSSHPVDVIKKIGDRFHIAAKELSRNGLLSLNNESDVQRLFHALLSVFFDDIRDENAVPDRMGASGRIDFYLPKEGIGIETKMTRKGLNRKKLGEELLTDISRYKALKGCEFLYCFVYDPAQNIRNPRGFEIDTLEQSNSELEVLAAIRP